jgi:hypothetical protein
MVAAVTMPSVPSDSGSAASRLECDIADAFTTEPSARISSTDSSVWLNVP